MPRSTSTPEHLADIVESRYLWLSVGHLHRFCFQNLKPVIAELKNRGWFLFPVPRFKSDAIVAPNVPPASAVFSVGSCLYRNQATALDIQGDCSELFRAVVRMVRGIRNPAV